MHPYGSERCSIFKAARSECGHSCQRGASRFHISSETKLTSERISDQRRNRRRDVRQSALEVAGTAAFCQEKPRLLRCTKKLSIGPERKITGGLTPHCSSAFDSSDTSPLIQVLNYSFTACGWFETAVIAGEQRGGNTLAGVDQHGGGHTTCFTGTRCSESSLCTGSHLHSLFFMTSHFISNPSYASGDIWVKVTRH